MKKKLEGDDCRAGRRTGRCAWNASLISITTVTETTKGNGGRGPGDATGSWMDLFKGVYSAEDTIAKRHDVVCKGKGERDEMIDG